MTKSNNKKPWADRLYKYILSNFHRLVGYHYFCFSQNGHLTIAESLKLLKTNLTAVETFLLKSRPLL